MGWVQKRGREATKVEKDTRCQKWLQETFSDTCLFTDVFNMIENTLPKNRILAAKEIKWCKTAYCAAHGKNCKFRFAKDDLLVLGTPCVLFSRFFSEYCNVLGFISMYILLYGFTCVKTRIHTVSYRFCKSCSTEAWSKRVLSQLGQGAGARSGGPCDERLLPECSGKRARVRQQLSR